MWLRLETPARMRVPTAETARSLYMNNWFDTTGIWMSPQLAQTDSNTQYGPRLGELHYSPSGATS